MRVVCPYTYLHPLAEVALERLAPQVEYVEMHGNGDYWRLLCDLWAAGESFVIVEHDIELRGDEIQGFECCPEPWCVHEYYVADTLLNRSLGCTRFNGQLMADLPGLMTEQPARVWQSLDTGIAGLLDRNGYRPHVHTPQVLHHHYRPETGLCDCKGEHA